MALKGKNWDRDMFFEELRNSIENVMQGLSQNEEYDWGDEGKVGFKVSRQDDSVVVEIN